MDPDQAPQNVGQDLDPNCLTLYRYSGNIFLEKKQQQQQQTDFEKYQQTTNNLVGKKSQWIEMEGATCHACFMIKPYICGIDFVESADIDSPVCLAMQIYQVYLLGYTCEGKTTKLFFCTGDLGFIYK